VERDEAILSLMVFGSLTVEAVLRDTVCWGDNIVLVGGERGPDLLY
jgi:hypothetical protein